MNVLCLYFRENSQHSGDSRPAGDEGQVSPNDVDTSNVIDYKEVADILFNANNTLSN